MKRKQIILAVLFICVTTISCFAQNLRIDRKIKIGNQNSLADLRIRQVKFAGKNGKFLKVEVENIGNKTSDVTRLLLTIEEGNKSLKWRQKEVFVAGIASGETNWVSIMVPLFLSKKKSIKSANFKLVIDSDQSVPESNEDNNEYVHQAEIVDSDSTVEPKDSDENINNNGESSDETLNEESESVGSSSEESETADETADETVIEEAEIEEEENSVDESENPDTSDEDAKSKKENTKSKSSKKEKIKAVTDLIDNINVLIKPSSKSKKKP